MQHVLCQVKLTSNLHEGQRACVGEMLNFTWTVTGTDFLAWSSEAYIGANNAQLEFLSADQEGKVLNGSNLSATLVDVSGEGATRILLSTLHIRVSTTPTIFIVTCLNINGVRSNISVSLLTGTYYITTYTCTLYLNQHCHNIMIDDVSIHIKLMQESACKHVF